LRVGEAGVQPIKERGMTSSVTWIDWAIVFVMALSVVAGVRQGFFRSVCSLGGLFLGLVVAAWNYARVAALLMPAVRIEAVANTIGFLLIALLVMALIGILGAILAGVLHEMGLGFLDRLAGGIFGLLQGWLLVMLCILVAVAFFPKAHWLAQGKLPKQFFGACHLSTHITPKELAERVRHGLKTLEEESPAWLHPGYR
jgi:membrane protein required for colicin V production